MTNLKVGVQDRGNATVYFGLLITAVLLLTPLNGLTDRISSELAWPNELLEAIEALLLFSLLLFSFWVGWRRRFLFAVTTTDIFLLIYLLIAGLSFLSSESSITEHLLGLRYSAALFTVYFAGRILGLWDNWRKGAWLALMITAAIGALQLLCWLIIPSSRDWSLIAVKDFANGWPRLYGPFAGANQFATWLVLGGLGTVFLASKIRWLGLGLIVLILATFSRSALLGLVGSLLAVIALVPGHRRIATFWLGVVAVVVLTAVGLGSLTASRPLSAAVSRVSSDRDHISSPRAAVKSIFSSDTSEIIFGHGAGTAGPATLGNSGGIIAENWYLQVAYEYGLVGLATILGFFLALLRQSFLLRQPELLAMTVAVMINSLFLHPLSDNAAATILFFLGAGSIISNEDKLLSRDV